MPNEESKPVDEAKQEEAVTQAVEELQVGDTTTDKKPSKKDKVKNALSSLGSSSKDNAATPPSADAPLPAELIDKLSTEQLAALLSQNPALRNSLPSTTSAADQRALRDALKNVSANELMTGLSKGKNAKDMASHKFWSTQPVTRFDESSTSAATTKPAKPDGPIKQIDAAQVPSTPTPLVDGFEWSEVDLTTPEQLEEVRALLSAHYVEDDEALFRFNYSAATLRWAMLSPEWLGQWHVGVRATQSRRLVAFISAIPLTLIVRGKEVKASEVNFMCVHKKLRSKRLAPVLIGEITRRCYREGVFQAIYTGGNVLPTPVASCRYFHRALDWEKLYNVGFSPMPHGSTKTRQMAKYKLPERPATNGLRLMEERDVKGVAELLARYLKEMQLSQSFSEAEVKHWLLDKEVDAKAKDRVVWTYVVEEKGSGKITDFVSFYCLESTIINQTGGNSIIRAAYLFYYASEAAFGEERVLAERLNALVRDALILAKQAKFDVFNALTLMDNPLFLQKQLFGAGDGQLHYYLFNYRTPPVNAGVDDKNQVDDKKMRGVGVVML